MNKKLWMATFLLVALFVLSACNGSNNASNTSIVEDKTCDTGNAIKDSTGQRCVTTAEMNLINDAVAKYVGGGSSQGSEPTATSAPATEATSASSDAPAASTNTGQTATCGDVNFNNYIGKPYELLSILDAQTGATPQNQESFTLFVNEANLYWTGNYNAGSAPSGFNRMVVDGDTGVFCVPAGTEVTVNFAGKYMPAAQFNSSATPNTVDDMPTANACMPTDVMVQALNDLGRTDPEAFFRKLDQLTNVEGAPHLAARYRPEPLEAKTYQGLVSGTAVFWVQEGQVGGKMAAPEVEDPDYVLLVESNGKWAVLNLKDTLELKYAHTGVQLCEGLDLAAKVTWWK